MLKKCVDSSRTTGITKHKEYNVTQCIRQNMSGYYTLINDKKRKTDYRKERFQ
jgi:hypothetical protein